MKYFFLLIVYCGFSFPGLISTSTKNLQQPGYDKFYKQDTGWVYLFDGKTLKGWHIYGEAATTSAWDINDNAIHLDASKLDEDGNTINGGDLLTDNMYSDFDLKYEWKISKGGNSGVKIFVQENTTKFDEALGLEMQVVDDENHTDGKTPKHRAGGLYDLIAPSFTVAKSYGEWNDAEIICTDGKLQFYLNKTKIVETTLWNDNWKKLIAHSKYKHMKDWGTFKTGQIALQDHGFEVWYKNIMVKKIVK